MNLNKRILYISAGLLLVLILLAVIFRSSSGKRIDWRETYVEDSREPYGTEVIYNLLENYFPQQEFTTLRDSIKGKLPNESESGNYVFIGEAMFMDSSDLRTLLNFVTAGNTALISCKTIPFDLMFHLYYDECEDAYWEDFYQMVDTVAYLNFQHPSLRADSAYQYQFFRNGTPTAYEWGYIEDYYFCGREEGLVPIGYMNDSLANFARRKMGEGYFYLHTQPLVFSNIQLLDKQGQDYIAGVLSHLQEGDIYWDAYSRVPEWLGRRRNQDQYYGGNRSLSSESPLQYILGQPPLAWAWYLLLGMGLLYLIFRAKRKQRMIPVLESNKNTSLEFIATIGRLYFIQNNHRKLALQQMKLFLGNIRERYFMNTRELDATFVEKLAHKAEVNPESIDRILLLYKNIKSSSFVSENTLVDFHQLLDDFYRNSK
jgi:hypothetical protein